MRRREREVELRGLTLAQARIVEKLGEQNATLIRAIEGGFLDEEVARWRLLRQSPTATMLALAAEKFSRFLGEPISAEQAEVIVKWAIARDLVLGMGA